MARPLKKGIDYYPLEVDIDEDDKFFDLFDEYGTDRGLGMVILILSNIYKNEGYFMKWSDSVCKKISRKKHIDRADLQEAVNILTGTSKNYVEPDNDEIFFDNHLYKTEKILTSKSIQKRFFIAADRRKERQIIKQFLLLPFDKAEVQTGIKYDSGIKLPIVENSFFITIDKKKIPFDFYISGHIEDNVSNNKDNVSNNSVNDNASTQTRGEEIKLKETERRGEEIKGDKKEIKKNKKEIKREDYPYLTEEQIEEVLKGQGLDGKIVKENHNKENYSYYEGW